jgi:hypothetical protein
MYRQNPSPQTSQNAEGSRETNEKWSFEICSDFSPVTIKINNVKDPN